MNTRLLLPAGLISVPVALAVFAMAGGGVGDASWLGMTVEDLTRAEAAQMGVPTIGSRVVVVKVSGAALAAGIVARDVIIGVNGQTVSSKGSFLSVAQDAMSKRRADGQIDDIVITVRRYGQTIMVTVTSEFISAYGAK
jgi:S1-C subfamily serine protease